MGETLNFYDLKAKRKFSSGNYRIVTKGGRRFAVATSPNGNECWRIIGRD